MVRRINYIERGGDLAARSDEVLALGRSGPDMGDWLALDRAEIRSDAVVGREIVCAIPNTLSLAAQVRASQVHADYLRELSGVVVRWSLHRADKAGDDRNMHVHIDFSVRRVDDEGHIDCDRKVPGFDLKTGSQQTTAMLRSHWQDTVNREFAAAGLRERLDLRTRKAQNLQGEALTRIPKVEYLRARRGQAPSTHYARNQTILALRTATAAVSNAATSLTRVLRFVAIGTVVRRRRERTRRARAGRRSVDFARATARIEGERLPGNRGGELRDTRAARSEQRPAVRSDLANPQPDDQRQADQHAQLDLRGVAGNHRRGGEKSEPTAVLEVRKKLAQDCGVSIPEGPTARSLVKRALRWIIGANRREADAPAQTEHTAALGRTQADAEAQAERVRRVAQEATERTRQEQIQTEAKRYAAQAQTITRSTLPLVSIRTQSGTMFYARRVDLIAARAKGHRDVPLCFLDGSPVQSGGKHRATLRLSTIEAAEVAPCAVVELPSYMHEEQNQEHTQDGLRITL